MKINPDDYAKSNQEFEKDSEENVGDYINSLNNRWEKLITNPYLSLNVDNPKYAEPFSPNQIIGAAEALVNDAKQQLESSGVSADDIQQAQQAAQQYNQLQFDRGDQKLTVTGDKVKQLLESQKRYREKLKNIKRIGVGNLAKRRNDLTKQIGETTNQIEKEELIRQLDRMPNPEQYEKWKANIKRNFDKIMTDPLKRQQYFQLARTRQQQRRVRDRKARQHINEQTVKDLVEKLSQTANQSEKYRLAKDLIEMEKEILEKQGLDLDDPFIFNSPEVQAKLNPLNIIKKYQDRFARIKKERLDEIEKSKGLREKGRTGGDIDGLVEIFRDQLATVVNELKKKIDKKIIKEGLNDPFFKPYLDAVAKATDDQSRQAALIAQQAAVKEYKNTHFLVTALVAKLVPLEEVKKNLMTLTSHSRKGDREKNNPWLYNENIPEEKKTLINNIVNVLDRQAGQFKDVAGADLDHTITNISNALKSKIGKE